MFDVNPSVRLSPRAHFWLDRMRSHAVCASMHLHRGDEAAVRLRGERNVQIIERLPRAAGKLPPPYTEEEERARVERMIEFLGVPSEDWGDEYEADLEFANGSWLT